MEKCGKVWVLQVSRLPPDQRVMLLFLLNSLVWYRGHPPLWFLLLAASVCSLVLLSVSSSPSGLVLVGFVHSWGFDLVHPWRYRLGHSWRYLGHSRRYQLVHFWRYLLDLLLLTADGLSGEGSQPPSVPVTLRGVKRSQPPCHLPVFSVG